MNAYPNQYYRTNVNTSPADLNKRITLQYPTKVGDGMGGFTNTWADAATIWAGIWPLRGDEAMAAAQAGGTITHRIRIRYRAKIRTSWRVKFGNRYFNIAGPPVNIGEENRWMDLLCKEAA